MDSHIPPTPLALFLFCRFLVPLYSPLLVILPCRHGGVDDDGEEGDEYEYSDGDGGAEEDSASWARDDAGPVY